MELIKKEKILNKFMGVMLGFLLSVNCTAPVYADDETPSPSADPSVTETPEAVESPEASASTENELNPDSATDSPVASEIPDIKSREKVISSSSNANYSSKQAEATAKPSPSPAPAKKSEKINDPGIAMYRLYNPNSGEHFYTSNWNEAAHTISAGWNSEGVGWFAPSNGKDVYRLYNKNGGEHHYTMSVTERNTLVSKGWKYEGVGWKSGGSIALHREYNPNAFANNHNYTTNTQEHNHLVSLGWKDEGIAWYATGTSNDRMRGIDISEWNKDIDLTPYIGQFVIIRAGYGWANNPSATTADNFYQIDKRLKQNVQKCEALGIPYGLYWFSYATTTEEARLEAETFYNVTKNYHPSFGFWMDEEGDNWKNTHNVGYENHDNITRMVNAFDAVMRNHGCKIGVYASYNWFNQYISTNDPKWVAHYGKNDGKQDVDLSADGRRFVMHQYTSNPIDKNLLYVSYVNLFN